MTKQELLKIIDDEIDKMHNKMTNDLYFYNLEKYQKLGSEKIGAEKIRKLINEKWKD